jgi:thiazole synthase
MAAAFRLAVEAGRRAHLAGLGSPRDTAEPSSPLTGFLDRLPPAGEGHAAP